MREKIAKWRTEVRTGVTVTRGKDANFICYPYSEEEETNQLLTLLREGIEKLRYNPTQYHYVCWASGIVKVRDEWGSEETHQCRAFNGDFNCGYRECKTGVIKGRKELRDWERAENEMLQKVLALLEKGQ